MWERPNNLIDQKEYRVMDGNRFVQMAVFKDEQFINKVTKRVINNVVRVWM